MNTLQTRFIATLLTACLCFFSGGNSVSGQIATQQPLIPDLLESTSFLQGNWQGNNDGLIFEEQWNAPAGGVMTAMVRGVRNGELAVLEYIVLAQTNNGVAMHFKHFRSDYSNWDGEEKPITLFLTSVKDNDIEFTNQDRSAIVQRIRYFMTAPDQLQADIDLLREGVVDKFSLTFNRVAPLSHENQ